MRPRRPSTLTAHVQDVPNPDDQPIVQPTGSWYPASLHKHADPIRPTETEIQWVVGFSVNTLSTYFPSGIPETLTFTDVIGEGHVLVNDPARIQLAAGPTPDNLNNWVPLANAAVGEVGGSGFTMSAKGDPKNLTITVGGPFVSNVNYYLVYRTKPSPPTVDFDYVNTVTLEGAGQTRTYSTRYSGHFDINIIMEDGFGSVELTKVLAGDAATVPGSAATYTVHATWRLPDGKRAADYPTWIAPTNPVVLTLTEGAALKAPVTFPVGTTITFSEVAPSPIQGVVWGTPAFSPSSLVIENAVWSPVTVTNTVNAVPPTPQEPPAPQEPPTPQVTPAKPGKVLAATGVELTPLLGGASILLMLGVALGAGRRSHS